MMFYWEKCWHCDDAGRIRLWHPAKKLWHEYLCGWCR